MAKYIVDANLPYYFGLWNNSDYIYVKDIDDSWNDNKIWEYAKTNDLIIITKDADFSLKILSGALLPKVIHIKVGNLRIKQFHELISKIWDEVENEIKESILINVYRDKIETII